MKANCNLAQGDCLHHLAMPREIVYRTMPCQAEAMVLRSHDIACVRSNCVVNPCLSLNTSSILSLVRDNTVAIHSVDKGIQVVVHIQ